MTTLSPAVVAALQRFDTPTICNVIELCRYRPHHAGTLNASIRAVYPELPPFVGHAVTATFRSSQPISPHEKPINLFDQRAAFEAVPAPRVIVIQDLDDPLGGAVYGEIMARLCQSLGCVALVTNGYARDILQVGSLAFPCFAAGICATHANCRVLSINQPVTVGGVTIAPGDVLHGDANGVTTIPAALVGPVADACQAYVDAEQILIDAIAAGRVGRGEHGPALEMFGQRIDALAQRLGGAAADRSVGV